MQRRLGAGGMGEVYLAHDSQLDRLVAIKRVAIADAPEARRLALKEAQVVAKLTHPHIAQLYDVVEAEGVVHLVMEFVEGETLAAVIARKPCDETEVRAVGAQLADALAFAHEHGVVHCDVKPANVMLAANGSVRLLDFGIAQIELTTRVGTATTSPVTVRGTLPYIAPEVLLGAPPTPRSDVYSLGVTLFEACTGRRPFEGGDAAHQLNRSALTPRVRDFVPALSEALSDIVASAMAASPDDRPASAAKVGAVLSRQHLTAWHQRRGVTMAAAAAGLAISVVAAIFFGGRPAPGPAATAAPAVVGVMVNNLTGDDEHDHLTVGLAETLVTRLSNAPGLTVMDTGALTPYVGKPDGAIVAARDLGLTHVLSASLQGAPAALRLSIAVVGRDGRVVWGATVDGTDDRFLDFQQRVSTATLAGLRGSGLINPAPGSRPLTKPTMSEEAFDQWSYGRVMLARRDVPGNIDRAVRFFERASELDPQFGWAHAALGEASWLKYRETRDEAWVTRAQSALLRALQLAPDDPTVRYTMALLAQGTGRREEALENLRLVIELQPANDEAYRLRARILADQRDLDGAIRDLREAERLRPGDPATARQLGLAYLEAGHLDEAVAAFTRLTSLQPDNASAFQLLGTAYHSAGELDRALVAYERANAITPRAPAYSNIGIIHDARGEFAKAVASYRQAIAIQPKQAATHRNLAESLSGLGRSREAAAEYVTAAALARDAIRVNPADARAHALVGLCEARVGHESLARAAIAEARRLAPNDNEVAYKAALIEIEAKRLDAAAAELKRAFDLGYSLSFARTDRALAGIRTRADVRAWLDRPISGTPAGR
ncbi:MAG: protein kinase [Acidobacteria bacterium]|nr:protein kinase [Acidobacteriota bacterium]